MGEIPAAECNALVAFDASTYGPNWLDQTNWLVTDTPCDWASIICSEGHVQNLEVLEEVAEDEGTEKVFLPVISR